MKNNIIQYIAIIVFCLSIFIIGAGLHMRSIQQNELTPYHDKIVFENQESAMASMMSPTLENLCRLSDVIIKGQIVSIEGWNYPLEVEFIGKQDTNPTASTNEYEFTKYRIAVEDVLSGEIGHDSVLSFVLLGYMNEGVTKPLESGGVVLFMNEYEDLDLFGTVALEHGIFTFDDNHLVYSYSNTEELSRYVGKSMHRLREDIIRMLHE